MQRYDFFLIKVRFVEISCVNIESIALEKQNLAKITATFHIAKGSENLIALLCYCVIVLVWIAKGSENF